MQYNPGVYDRSGEIIAAGTMQAAQTQADLMRELGEKARQTAAAVAGFAAGGPAGAAMASGGGSGGGGGGGEGLIGSLINSFANKKAMDAKDKAYLGFFERHGEDLGFDPQYLQQLKSMPREERLMSFDIMTGAPAQRLGSLQYLNTQASLFPRNTGTGAGGGGGGGSVGAGDYVVGGGWGG